MKTIHHVIAAAVDAGLNEPDAEALAQELYGTEKPIALLDKRILDLEEQLGQMTKFVNALRDIRGKWGAQHGETPYQNGHEETRLRAGAEA